MKKLLLYLSVFLGIAGASVAQADMRLFHVCTFPGQSTSEELVGSNKTGDFSLESYVKSLAAKEKNCTDRGGISSTRTDEYTPTTYVAPAETPVIAHQSEVNYITDTNNSPATFEVASDAYDSNKNTSVVYESTHNFVDSPDQSPTIEDPKIALLQKQVELLKSMIQLLMARLEAMKGI